MGLDTEKAVIAPYVPNYAYQSDVTWLSNRIDKLEKKFKIILAIMISKKLIDPEVAKVIYETTPENQANIIEWYLKENGLKK